MVVMALLDVIVVDEIGARMPIIDEIERPFGD
jgi:hypothetical protein